MRTATRKSPLKFAFNGIRSRAYLVIAHVIAVADRPIPIWPRRS